MSRKYLTTDHKITYSYKNLTKFIKRKKKKKGKLRMTFGR